MEKHGPWTTLDSKTVHDTPWLTIDFHQVINPGGIDSYYTTVHFKNYAIGVVALDKDQNIYLVGQYRYPIKQYSWEIPEGGGDRSITPLESAQRELMEETGIKAKHWQELKRFHVSNSATDEYAILFLATELSYFDPEPEDDEDLQTKKLPLSDFFKMVENEEITDSLTVIAALHLENMMLKKKISL